MPLSSTAILTHRQPAPPGATPGGQKHVNCASPDEVLPQGVAKFATLGPDMVSKANNDAERLIMRFIVILSYWSWD
jgi:hypothetical protein